MIGNNVILIGRFTADPELRQTQSGVSVTSFTLAVNKPYNKEHDHPEANFINCVAWRGTAEFINKYFRKGNKIAIRGYIQTRKFTDKNGNNRTAFEIVVDEAGFIEAKKDNNDANFDVECENTSNNNDDAVETDEDLPF